MIEWSQPYPAWLYPLVGCVLAAGALLARRWAISERLRKWTLFVPRLFVLGSLLVILLDPVRRSEFQLPARPAQVIGLVDCSRSMALDAPVSRLDQAKQAIQASDAAPRSPDQARLSLYRCGSQLGVASDIWQLSPVDDASQLGEALERLPSRFSREPPKAVVLFSDGVASDPERLVEVSAGYQRLGIPVHVYPLGDQRIRGDVAIQDLVVPQRVDANTKATIRGVVRSEGFDGQRVEVQVRPAQAGKPPVATLPLTLTAGEQPFELLVDANPDQTELVLEVPPLEGEITQRNNQIPFQLGTKRRKVRVLYMEGTGGPEYHWVQDALQEEPNIECLSMVVDQQYAQRPRLMRVGDPYKGFPATREELLSYDVVICSDISRGAFTKEQLDWTVELVAERGGGFAMVGGITSFGAGGWDQTVWDQLIPVDMTGGRIGQGWLYHNFRVRVPPEAEQHPIWRIVPDAAQNRRILDAMPAFGGTNYVTRLKPAATLLAVSATPIPNAGIMPIFACESYGKGRTFAFAPDTTVDWGRFFESQWGEGDNRYFRRFWRNVVRWLCENSINGNLRLTVETDRLIYRPGQPIEVSAVAFDEKLVATTNYQLTARLLMSRTSAGSANSNAAERPGVALATAASGKGYSGQLTASLASLTGPLAAQELQGMAALDVEVVATSGGQEIARSRVPIRLLDDSPELRRPRADRRALQDLAQATGGSVLENSQALRQLLQSLPAIRGDVVVTKTPLWDRSLIWMLLIGLLSVEWILRRRAGFG